MRKAMKWDWQKKIIFRSMGRLSLLTVASLSMVIMAVYLISDGWAVMSQDPFSLFADVLIRSMAGPIIAIPCLLNYYRKKATGSSYYRKVDSENWAGALMTTGILVFIIVLMCGAIDIFFDISISWQTFKCIIFIFSCGILGALYSCARIFPALVAIQVICCSLLLLFGSFEGMKIGGCLVAISLTGYGLIRLIVFAYDALVDLDEILDKTEELARRFGRWAVPELKEKSRDIISRTKKL